MQINSANQYGVGPLFSSNLYFSIPKYQREYTWGQSNWSALYDDLIENDMGYFIGSIICIPNSTDSAQIIPLEVVDGQQRLTTISLLMAALYSKFKEYSSEMSEDQNHEVYEIKSRLSKPKAANGLIVSPQDQNHNREDFIYVMREAGILGGLDDTKKPAYFGIRNIKRCYEFFRNQIQKDVDESEDPLSKLFSIKETILSAIMVKIEVASHSDAYVMFEALNNRGSSLTAVDLMKNAALARSEKSGMRPEECFDKWQNILDLISSDYTAQERFFRFHYNAFRSEINTPFRTGDSTYPLGDIATKSNLLKIYIRLIDTDLIGFLESIKTSARIYNQFLTTSDSESRYLDEFKDLNNIKGVSGYIILLYLIRNQEKLGLTDEQIKSITRFLSKFFVRRNLTDVPPTRDVNRMFMKLISVIEEKALVREELEQEIYSFLISNSASDEVFEAKLSGDIYTDNTDATRYILCKLAESMMTKETWTDLWEKKQSGKNMIYVWTIEHIFPEGNNVPKDWVDMISDGDPKKASEYRDEYCHKLGNLTVTGYNSDLSNMSFKKKRDRTNENKKYIGYRNGLEINHDLASKESWKIDDIKERTDRLIQACMEMFDLKPQ